MAQRGTPLALTAALAPPAFPEGARIRVRGHRVKLLWLLLPLLVSACAADTPRDYEPFDRARGSRVELPPPPDPRHEEDRGQKFEKRSARIARGFSLEEAEKLALEVNPSLFASAEAVNAARANVWQQTLFTNPVVSVGPLNIPTRDRSEAPFPAVSGASNLFSPFPNATFTDPANGIVIDRPKAWSLTYAQWQFTIQKDFDVSGKRVARVDAAVEGARQSEAQYASAAFAMKAAVRVAFAGVLVAERNLDLSRESEEMARRNLEIQRNRAAAGNALPGDGERAASDAERARIDLAQAERDLEHTRRALATLLGDPAATVGPLRGGLPLSIVPGSEDGARLAAEALERNSDVVAAQRAVRAAEANLRLQERSVVPDITVGFQATYAPKDPTDPVFDDYWLAGVTVSVPFPIFDQNRAQISQAHANLRQANAQERALELTVNQNVRQNLLQVRTSQARIDAFANEILPRARTSVGLAETAYEGGKTLYLDVIAARQNFNQQRSDYVTELMNYEGAVADLERLLGRPVR
jgi:cobalt-zinc-cadmium efflux system outer membrane protein